MLSPKLAHSTPRWRWPFPFSLRRGIRLCRFTDLWPLKVWRLLEFCTCFDCHPSWGFLQISSSSQSIISQHHVIQSLPCGSVAASIPKGWAILCPDDWFSVWYLISYRDIRYSTCEYLKGFSEKFPVSDGQPSNSAEVRWERPRMQGVLGIAS